MRVRAYTVVALVVVAGCARAPQLGPAPLNGSFDVIIENGKITDGTGAAWFYGDVGVINDRIAAIVPRGLLRNASATERIDATGLVVAPGFIDIQSHSRGAFLRRDGRVVSKITQGITTEIMGEGSTNAPANRWTLSATGEPDPEDLERAKPFMGPRSFSNWLEAMEEHGTTPNFGSFVGASTIREYGKGMAQGPADGSALDSMRTAVRWSMEGGAFGIASALVYPPGNFASTDELIEISKAMAPYGGVYITHLRSEADQFLDAVREAIAIGQGAGVPVEVYHLKAAGKRNWPKAARAIALIDSARAAGVDIQANMYPYIAGGTGLSACLPPAASADGKLFENLGDPETRAAIKQEVLHQTTDWESFCDLATPENVLILGLEKPENEQFIGKRLSEIAAAQGKDWVETVMDLLVSEEQRIGTIYFLMTEENVRLQLRQPWIKFGTDAGGMDPDSAQGLTHPRAYGNYPRILGKYVRDEGVLSLEDAVRKMSSAVATRLSIQDRGVLRERLYADIVIFDPSSVSDRATFEQPHQLSVGMQYVLVNGVVVVRNGLHTGAKPGRIVWGPGYRGRR